MAASTDGAYDPKTAPQWAAHIISQYGVRAFYASWPWRTLALRTSALHHYECELCRKRGLYSPCEAVHHIKPIKIAPELAMEPSNLMCLCAACHSEIHGKIQKALLTPERW